MDSFLQFSGFNPDSPDMALSIIMPKPVDLPGR